MAAGFPSVIISPSSLVALCWRHAGLSLALSQKGTVLTFDSFATGVVQELEILMYLPLLFQGNQQFAEQVRCSSF